MQMRSLSCYWMAMFILPQHHDFPLYPLCMNICNISYYGLQGWLRRYRYLIVTYVGGSRFYDSNILRTSYLFFCAVLHLTWTIISILLYVYMLRYKFQKPTKCPSCKLSIKWLQYILLILLLGLASKLASRINEQGGGKVRHNTASVL